MTTGINCNGLRIGPGAPVFIIAEAGINHEGDLNRAFDLVDAAAETGADAVKFQNFFTELVITRKAPKANYHIATTGDDAVQSWFDLIKSEELPPDAFRRIAARCRQKGIMFLSTPYDAPSVDLLVEIGAPAIKVASTDANNLPLLRHMARTGLPILLSTGMTDMAELEVVIRDLRENRCEQLAVMQCTAEYPAPESEINLLAMRTIAERFGVAVGYSDHTRGSSAAVAAVALGACVYEKHFTLDKTAHGPDHRASMEPDDLKALITEIRAVERMLGDGVKRVMPCEARNKPILQKYVVAARDVSAGTILTEKDVTTKRTGGVGVPALDYFRIIGRRLGKPVAADVPVSESDLA